MKSMDFLYDHHIVQGLVPVADAFAGGVTTDVISLENYRRCTFVIITGAIEDDGISNVVTVNSCDDTTPSNATAMAFRHRSLEWSTSADTWGDLTVATSSGYNLTDNHAVANAVHTVEVTAEEVDAASAGNKFVQLAIAETADKTVTGAVLVILSEPRYMQETPVSAIS